LLGTGNSSNENTKADTSAPPLHAHKFEKPEAVSVGEKWWNRITYTGIGYGANLVVSLAIWDSLLDGRARPIFDKIVSGVEKGLKAGGMEHSKAATLAYTGTKMACSPLGGHITMIPVKIFEDHARYITHVLNKQLDPNYKYKDLQVDWNTPDTELPGLANEPNRNTWGQVAIRRGLGWAAVTASGVALAKSGFEEPLERWTLDKMQKGVKLSGSPALERFNQKDVVQRWTKLAALDMYFTVVTSAITALTKNTFGQARDSVSDDALSIDIPGVTTTNEDLFLVRPITPPVDEPHTKHAAKHKSHKSKHLDNPMKHHENFQDRIAADKQNTTQPEPRL
jgi:hypothetical protein